MDDAKRPSRGKHDTELKRQVLAELRRVDGRLLRLNDGQRPATAVALAQPE